MSRKSRNQRDKRAEAFDLARICGHGTSFDDVADEAEPVSGSGDELKSWMEPEQQPNNESRT
jgi:hypothetical protein